jgi:hypothetical protein
MSKAPKKSSVWFKLETGDKSTDEKGEIHTKINTSENCQLTAITITSITLEIRKELHKMLDSAIDRTNENLGRITQ